MNEKWERAHELIEVIEEYPPFPHWDNAEDEEKWSDAISELKILLEDLRENYRLKD